MKLVLGVSDGEYAQAMKHHELYHCLSPLNMVEGGCCNEEQSTKTTTTEKHLLSLSILCPYLKMELSTGDM